MGEWDTGFGPGDERSGEPGRDGARGEDWSEQLLAVEVPDDLRALAADVAAYHREVRLARRRARLERWLPVRQWRRLGPAAPVLAGVLAIVVAVAGLFVALHPGSSPLGHADPLASSPSAGVGTVGGLIPDAPVVVGGAAAAVSVRTLRPAVLALVPRACGCQPVIEALSRQAGQFGLRLYVVAPVADDPEVPAIAAALHGTVYPTADATGALARTYAAPRPAAADSVTALLLRSDGVVVDAVHGVTARTDLGTRLTDLSHLS